MIDKHQSDKKQYQKAQKKLNQFLDLIEKDGQTGQNEENKEIEEEELDEVTKYGKEMLQRYMRHNKKIRINQKEIISKVTMKKLREKFIELNADKSFSRYSKSLLDLSELNDLEIKNCDIFNWRLSRQTIDDFLENGCCASKPYKTADRTKFYFQMNIMDEQVCGSTDIARITLILWKLPNNKTSKTASFDIYCKALNKFYVRFHDIEFRLDSGQENTRQGAEFQLSLIRQALDKDKTIEWKIAIGE